MPTATFSLALTAALVCSASVLAAPTLALDQNATVAVTKTPEPYVPVTTTGPDVECQDEDCEAGDVNCWCLQAVAITNRLRAMVGKGPIVPGPQEMLANAVDHSKAMANGLGLEQPNLSEARDKVGCGLDMLYGVAVAVHYILPSNMFASIHCCHFLAFD